MLHGRCQHWHHLNKASEHVAAVGVKLGAALVVDDAPGAAWCMKWCMACCMVNVSTWHHLSKANEHVAAVGVKLGAALVVDDAPGAAWCMKWCMACYLAQRVA